MSNAAVDKDDLGVLLRELDPGLSMDDETREVKACLSINSLIIFYSLVYFKSI